MKSVSLPVHFDATTDDALFDTALDVPGVLAVLVDRPASSVRILAATPAAAEIARVVLRPWAA